jgi:hypothetical protein
VKARVRELLLSRYNNRDVDILLEKWRSEEKEYATHMKQLRALNDMPQRTRSKSFTRVTHEEVYIKTYIYVFI